MRPTLNGQLTAIVDELVNRGVTLEQARQEFERQFIIASLRSNDWNYCRSARSLGVHRNTLRNKVSNLGIPTSTIRTRGLGGRPSLRRSVPKV
jgi:DNA-binding NtrC family response regulator